MASSTTNATAVSPTGRTRSTSSTRRAWAAAQPRPTSQAPTARAVSGVSGHDHASAARSGATSSAAPAASSARRARRAATGVRAAADGVRPGSGRQVTAGLEHQRQHQDDRYACVDRDPAPRDDPGAGRLLPTQVELVEVHERHHERQRGEGEDRPDGQPGATPPPRTGAGDLEDGTGPVGRAEEHGGHRDVDGPGEPVGGAEGKDGELEPGQEHEDRGDEEDATHRTRDRGVPTGGVATSHGRAAAGAGWAAR